MAKRRTEIAVTHDPEDPPYSYTLWVDDPKVASKIKDIGGVIDMCDSCANKGPGWVWIDPRYDAAEVIAEIKALADGKEPRGDTPDSLRAEAADLGKRAAKLREASGTGNAYLLAADQVHGHSTPWLYSVRACVESLCKNRGLDPQPEPSLAEAARALGQKAGARADVTGGMREFLKGAEETYGTGYLGAVGGAISVAVARLARGSW